jgi:hypothetical protein
MHVAKTTFVSLRSQSTVVIPIDHGRGGGGALKSF